jgi:peptidoglycan/LPS O-acetylase OafA/YrhL
MSAGAAGIAAPPDDHERLGVLDGLRALSICLVLAAHLAPLGPKPLQLNANAGAMGMCLFFALSGFLIMRTLQRSSVADFLLRRAARLAPLAWLYLLVVGLLHGPGWEAMLAGFAFSLNYRPDLMIRETEHLWSLGVEMHFYLAVAAIAALHRRAVLLVWPMCLAVTALRVSEGAHLSIATHLRVDEILAGACLALVPAAWLRPRSSHSAMPWTAAAAAWIVTSHPDSGALQFARPYATALLVALTLRLPDGGLRLALTTPAARYVASISYALYVIHPLTAHGWWSAGTLTERYLFKRPVSLVITFALAHASTRWWEAWWIDRARQVIAERGRPIATSGVSAMPPPEQADAAAAAAAPSAHRPAAE